MKRHDGTATSKARISALNAVCPYYTMYPLTFPLRALRAHGRPGQWVLDPFCGRGTTNFAARLLGMPSIGIDSSPVAVAIAEAKLASVCPDELLRVATSILDCAPEPTEKPQGEFWRLAYHDRTLTTLCRLRSALLEECSTPAQKLLRAIVLGALHGPRPKGQPSYFSNQCPRTFAPKPAYAVKFWKAMGMRPVDVDVLAIIKVRAGRYLAEPPPTVNGKVVLGDSRKAKAFPRMPKAQLAVTSPPYFGMRTYLPDQWLRLWFLGGPDHVDYGQPAGQLEHSSVDRFAAEMGLVWKNVAKNTTEDARLIVRYGGIHDRSAEPIAVLKKSLIESGWKMRTAKAVPDADNGRRQVRQFQAEPKKAITEYDVYCHRV